MSLGSYSRAATIDWMTVGNPGNAPDTTTYGAVSTAFRIMKFEFTNEMYTDFLNSVDANGTNPNSVYDEGMGTDARGGISFTSGNAPGSKYAIKTNMGDKPVNHVSWFDAARVSNWLMNGGTSSSSTETGAYTLSNAISGNAPAVNSGATFYIPTANQWYKAAYYSPVLNSGTGGYWDYATQSDTIPTSVTSGTTGIGSASTGIMGSGTGNFANYNFGADWNGQDGNVTTVGTNGGPSFYGAFDMSGNLREWNDLTGATGSSRGLRGGAWGSSASLLPSSDSGALPAPSLAGFNGGFRLASAAQLIWNTTSGTWNTTSTVWTAIDGGTNAFTNGATVIFSGTGGGVVTISGSIQPSSITVSATSGTYSIVSSAGNLLVGMTSLYKLGGGTLVLSGSNAFTGSTSVTGGTLLVNGVLSSGTTTVSTGLLSGTGTIDGMLTVLAGGTLSPGNSPGTLRVGSLLLGGSSTTLMEITGTAAGLYDQVVGNGSGGLTYGGNLDLVMSGSYANGTTFNLFSNFSSPSISDFAAVGLDATGSEYAGLTFTGTAGVWTSTWTTNHQRLVFSTGTGDLVVVPEPSTYAMALAGLACGGWQMFRRRRLRQAPTLAA